MHRCSTPTTSACARSASKKKNESEANREEQRNRRLLAVGPYTGQIINILAKSLVNPTILEIGTSYCYSGIWLAEAACAAGGRLITLEKQAYKSAYAREMSYKAGLAGHVNFQVGDALDLIAVLPPGGIDFVLLDIYTGFHIPCLEAFYPKLNPGAIVVTDNMLRPIDESMQRYAEAVRAKPFIENVLLPVGSGIEVSRFTGAA